MAGYQRAFLAIFDGNLTTVITAIILFIFGTGLIRGFSVTLVAGILASMFTALVVTKLIFQATVKPTSTKKIKMMELVPPTISINFIKNTKGFILAAVVLIVVLDAVALIRGINDPSSIFAVDFTGGAKVTFEVANKDNAPLEKIRSSLEAAGIDDAKPQYQTADIAADGDQVEAKETFFLEVSTVHTKLNNKEISEVMETALKADMPEAGFKFIDVDSVGSQIGSEMKRTAYIAITLSTIAMLLYITLRFEFGFALGAIVALVHDVLITIGIFTAFGFQFNLTIVAAMLTIVGYGVNDTIVLFDRVREELKLNNKLSFPELANKCINVTLSRTLLTSITTLITVAALMIFTSGDIFGFATCMLIGIIVSTFSTIFIATPVMLAWYKNKRPNFAKK
jgi:preprotein translocase SecF subunit